MPHPSGIISVKYTLSGSSMNAEINLPEEITGTFVWKGTIHNLKNGENKFKL
jgi:alpha-L-rhamnosidase